MNPVLMRLQLRRLDAEIQSLEKRVEVEGADDDFSLPDLKALRAQVADVLAKLTPKKTNRKKQQRRKR